MALPTKASSFDYLPRRHLNAAEQRKGANDPPLRIQAASLPVTDDSRSWRVKIEDP